MPLWSGFVKKNFTEFFARLEKMVSVFLSSPFLGKIQKQDFVNNQALTKKEHWFLNFSEKVRKEIDFRQNPGKNGLISASCVCFLHTGKNVVKAFEQKSFKK